MINITQINKVIVVFWIFIVLAACEKSDQPHSSRSDAYSSPAIEAKIASPVDDIAGKSMVGSLLIVRRDPSLPDGRNVFVVLLNGYAGQKNLLFRLCAKNTFSENQNDIFLVGRMRMDSSCHGYVLVQGNFLKRDGSCRSKLNLDEVYLAKKGGYISNSCANFSIKKGGAEMEGNCSASEDYESFDTLGLVRCSKLL